MTITMTVIELRPLAPHPVGVIQPVNPCALRIVQCEAVFDAVRPAGGGFDQLRRDLDAIAPRELKFKAVEVEQNLQILVIGHIDIVATYDIVPPPGASGRMLRLSNARLQVSEGG